MGRVRSYFIQHLQAALFSVGHMWRTPLATLMTMSVIGVALVLPACLYLVVYNVSSLSADWDKGRKIVLFMAADSTQQQIDDVLADLQQRTHVVDVNYISPQQGLSDFSEYLELGDVFAYLTDNPLPPVVEVYPSPSLVSVESLNQLIHDLSELPSVELSQADVVWIQRLQTIVLFGERSLLALTCLLAMAVLLIVSNTIRLAIQNRRSEIAVFKLIGATNRFVRRPFLYTGLLYGLLGGIVASLLILVFLLWLRAPAYQLMELYHLSFTLSGLQFHEVLLLWCASASLGWLGAYFITRKQIKQMDC